MATISVQTKKFADLEAILSVTGTEQMLRIIILRD